MAITKERAEEIIDQLLADLDLHNNNSHIDTINEDEVIFYIGAPNESTVQVWLEYELNAAEATEEEFKTMAIREIRAAGLSFDAEEEFETLWSRGFGEHNNFTVFQFVDILKEDEEHFHNI